MARLGLYQPFIEDRNVRRLYQLKLWFREREGRRVPMTVLVNRILDEFFEGYPVRANEGSDPGQSANAEEIETFSPGLNLS